MINGGDVSFKSTDSKYKVTKEVTEVARAAKVTRAIKVAALLDKMLAGCSPHKIVMIN